MPSPGAGPYSPSTIISSSHPSPPLSPSCFVVTCLPLAVSYNLPRRVTHWLSTNLLRREWTCLFSLPGCPSLPKRAESGRLRCSVLLCVLFKIVIIFCLLWISSSKSKWCLELGSYWCSVRGCQGSFCDSTGCQLEVRRWHIVIRSALSFCRRSSNSDSGLYIFSKLTVENFSSF